MVFFFFRFVGLVNVWLFLPLKECQGYNESHLISLLPWILYIVHSLLPDIIIHT